MAGKQNPQGRCLSACEKRVDYGIDAPRVLRGMMVVGCCGLLVVSLANSLRVSERWSNWGSFLGLLSAAYGFFMASYMMYSSRVGKLRNREKLFELLALLRPWKGDENVLDVGCGRGLMLVGAARRLATGKAVGIDLWRSEDQSGNSLEAALENARREGVSDRVTIDTGDARRLPYPDASFDVVLSHWVIHNLEDAPDRQVAIDEMLRVLRPGGVIMLADIANMADYRTHLLSKGVSELRTLDGGLEALIMGLMSGGSYRPQALLAIRP
jgi:arsenite methyltransferase